MLTPRETQVLKLITQELTSREIARVLGITESTVETHRRHLFQKFKVRSVVGLIKAMMQQKVL
jgi:two-component system, NarL family, invasion response regulator UvrY